MQEGMASAPRRWLLLAVFAFAGSANAQPDNCEALRTQIESKIAASGVTGFSVSTVDATSNASGQVVGSCALGSRKIVYAREVGSAAGTTPSASPAPAKPRGSQMLTECKDGSTSVGGDCKR